jgi:predicted transcriptional regulator
MNLECLVEKFGGSILTNGNSPKVDIERIYAGDRISDLLNQANQNTLLVSNLASQQLLRMVHLMEAAGLCLVNGMHPDDEMIELANQNNTTLIVSPYDMFETCGRIYRCMSQCGNSAK